MNIFDPARYRAYNADLRQLDDDSLLRHFAAHQDEPRIFGPTSTTAEFLSMRWLRGNGMEIGAGGHPTTLYGNARALIGDCDDSHVFGGEKVDLSGSIDDPEFARGNEGRFDFAIASHVLEHADSLLRALQNLLSITKPDGIVYVVVPDIEGLHDKTWMPEFDFPHHIEEYNSPLAYAEQHDDLYIRASRGGILSENVHATISGDYQRAVLSGVIPQDQRFMHHKHNYSFDGWLQIMHQAREYLGSRFQFMDTRYGHERMDCHFVLKVPTANSPDHN